MRWTNRLGVDTEVDLTRMAKELAEMTLDIGDLLKVEMEFMESVRNAHGLN